MTARGMEDNNTQNKSSRTGKITTVVLIALAGAYIIFLLYQAVYFNYKTSQKINDLKIAVQKAQSDETRLKNLIAYYNTDTFKELEARKKLGLKMPGEKVVSVNFEKVQAVIPSAGTSSVNKPEKSNPELWIEFLSGKKSQ